MYLVLERVFLCVLLANIQQALQGIVTLQKIVLYRFARKSSFMGQGKTPCRLKQSLITFPAICDMKINNSCQKFLEERTNDRSIEEELQETFSLAVIFVYSLARGKKTGH